MFCAARQRSDPVMSIDTRAVLCGQADARARGENRRNAAASSLPASVLAAHCDDVLQIFRGLVLGCMDSYDSEKWRIFSDFSRSTRFSHFRTALNAKFQQISLTFSRNFNKICKNSKIRKILTKMMNFLKSKRLRRREGQKHREKGERGHVLV